MSSIALRSALHAMAVKGWGDVRAVSRMLDVALVGQEREEWLQRDR